MDSYIFFNRINDKPMKLYTESIQSNISNFIKSNIITNDQYLHLKKIIVILMKISIVMIMNMNIDCRKILFENIYTLREISVVLDSIDASIDTSKDSICDMPSVSSVSKAIYFVQNIYERGASSNILRIFLNQLDNTHISYGTNRTVLIQNNICIKFPNSSMVGHLDNYIELMLTDFLSDSPYYQFINPYYTFSTHNTYPVIYGKYIRMDQVENNIFNFIKKINMYLMDRLGIYIIDINKNNIGYDDNGNPVLIDFGSLEFLYE